MGTNSAVIFSDIDQVDEGTSRNFATCRGLCGHKMGLMFLGRPRVGARTCGGALDNCVSAANATISVVLGTVGSCLVIVTGRRVGVTFARDRGRMLSLERHAGRNVVATHLGNGRVKLTGKAGLAIGGDGPTGRVVRGRYGSFNNGLSSARMVGLTKVSEGACCGCGERVGRRGLL